MWLYIETPHPLTLKCMGLFHKIKIKNKNIAYDCKVTRNVDGWLIILTTCINVCKQRMTGARQLLVEDGWIGVRQLHT